MVAALLGGCVSPRGKTLYLKAGVSDDQKKKDEAQCVQVALDMAGPRGSPFLAVDRDVVDRCMRDRGYSATVPK